MLIGARRCSLDRVLEHYGVPFVNMSRGGFTGVTLADGSVLHHVELPEVLDGRVLVTVPALKTNSAHASSAYHDRLWWPLKGKRVQARLRTESQWGRLFDEY